MSNTDGTAISSCSVYYRTRDVVTWLLDHPGVKTGYLLDPGGARSTTYNRDVSISSDPVATPEQKNELRRQNCAFDASTVCANAHVGPYLLTSAFDGNDRAMRESGFDTSFRFGPFSGSTDHFAPVCLNALLYRYELDLAWMAAHLSKADKAAQWVQQAAAHKAAIDRYLWNAKVGMYFDYNFIASNANVQASAGYKQNVIGFGWTHDVYLEFKQFLSAPSKGGLSALRVNP